MTLNFKQPKYILPLIALPFLCLFFYVYHSGAAAHKKETQQAAGINGTVADVSPDIKKQSLENKLDAYRNTYKDADGNSAVIPIPTDQAPGAGQQQKMLDSINQAMSHRYNTPVRAPSAEYKPPGLSAPDKALADALNKLSTRKSATLPNIGNSPEPKPKDPMDLFRQQMAYLDSVRKLSDPAYQAEKQKQLARAKADELKSREQVLEVVKAGAASADFNTVIPEKDDAFISAIVDENVTGYAGSRIRLRLLEDIDVGTNHIAKGGYLYALISGFSGQRVDLSVKSIMYRNQLLPVKLEVYDLDGLQGLYVPESQFRDFTKDLGTNTIQGVTIGDDGSGSVASQMLMSTAGKMFESTSTAIAGAIRKDKAKIKYNSYIYLIDSENSKKQ